MTVQKKQRGNYEKVAVLLGGDSAEREISIQTGTAVCDALRRQHIDAYKFDPSEKPLMHLIDEKFDYVFIALHGRGGEDGTIQGALEYLGLPFTGSGVLGSALAMDKVRSKQVWQACGLPTPVFIEIGNPGDLDRVGTEIGYPVFVKPVNEGSSVGASKVMREEELHSAWLKARETDNRVLAERYIEGEEYTAAVLKDRVLPMIKLDTPREFYDYEAKYLEETTSYTCPCGLDEDTEDRLAEMVMAAFHSLDASGWGRIDFMMDSEGHPWLIELNTIPGMTSHSLVPMAAKQAGLSFDDLVLHIMETSTDIHLMSRVDKR